MMKQKNAFPPNFVHSLDSSHMMLTSMFCERAGITFVSVHDCYWTHPSTVHIMNKVFRKKNKKGRIGYVQGRGIARNIIDASARSELHCKC